MRNDFLCIRSRYDREISLPSWRRRRGRNSIYVRSDKRRCDDSELHQSERLSYVAIDQRHDAAGDYKPDKPYPVADVIAEG